MKKILSFSFFILFGYALNAQCPLVLSFSNDNLVGCDGDNFIFGIQFDDEDQGNIEWTLPDGTTTNEMSFGFSFVSPDGCNDVQTIKYLVTCEDGTVLEDDSLTVSIFTFNEAIVDIDNCTYTVMPDCPDDVEVVGGNTAGDVHEGTPGDSGVVFFEISNPGAPAECNVNGFNYNYNCVASGIEDVLEGFELRRFNQQIVIQNSNGPRLIESIQIFNLSGQRIWSQENFLFESGSTVLPIHLNQQPYVLSGVSDSGVWSEVFF